MVETEEMMVRTDQLKSTAEILLDARLETRFVDIIRTEATPDRLVLNLIQTLPAGDDGTEKMKVVYRAALSWSHVVRTRDLLVRLLEHYGPAPQHQLSGVSRPGEEKAATPDVRR